MGNCGVSSDRTGDCWNFRGFLMSGMECTDMDDRGLYPRELDFVVRSENDEEPFSSDEVPASDEVSLMSPESYSKLSVAVSSLSLGFRYL